MDCEESIRTMTHYHPLRVLIARNFVNMHMPLRSRLQQQRIFVNSFEWICTVQLEVFLFLYTRAIPVPLNKSDAHIRT